MKSCVFILLVLVSVSISACGGGNTTPTSTTYTIGVTISGLSGTGLVLQNNGGNNMPVSANGSFTFTSAIASGGSYNVSVFTQPSGPAQNCVVTNGSGTASANVTSVQITCSAATYTIGGTVINLAGTGGGLQLEDNGGDSLLVNANGTFTFTMALASGSAYSVIVSVQPSSPAQTCEVTDGSGTATANVTNIVVDCGHKEWAWVDGANIVNQNGAYGTQGTAAPGNIPGARHGSISCTDTAGNLWLFGGAGYDSAGTIGGLNDLWKYSGGEWTWISGSNVANQSGTYGTRGTAAPGNIPGARSGSISWADAAGNLWLFGGYGTQGYLNDLWKYSAGEWTWMSGSNVANQSGTYGTRGTAAPGNIPGARNDSISWTDAAGNLWLFGGHGYDSAGTQGDLNDLWKYSAGEWTWISGSNLANQSGTYGTQGTAAPGNIPGARYISISWTDAAGDLWLFGGFAYDSTGTLGQINDLWKYSAGEWTWMGGSNLVGQKGTYGTRGTAAPGNIPGARSGSISWADAAGNLWLFGGQGVEGAGGDLNDLWKYSAGEWTWMSGSNVANQSGMYGTEGAAAPGNIPGSRWTSISWTDAAGNFWLFGGSGNDSTVGTQGSLNDLWKYEP